MMPIRRFELGDPRSVCCVCAVDREASQTRDYCVAALLSKSGATHRAARPDPSPRKERLLRMTIPLREAFISSGEFGERPGVLCVALGPPLDRRGRVAPAFRRWRLTLPGA